MKIDRRQALGLLGLGVSAPAAAQEAQGRVAFRHGVASGDPLADSVILWTRLTPREGAPRRVPFRWRIAPASGGAPVRSGRGETGPERDYTVKVEAKGLKPGTEYRFGFEAGGAASPEGRTRTLPAGPTQDVVLAVASCALFPNGYFNAYRAIADQPRVDAVLHLGDYIYEYGGERSYGMDSPLAVARAHDPDHEILTLDDYRRRHAQYKSDPDLQAAHARAPWIVVWDDHETANNSWAGGAENHEPPEGDWAARKAAALKAYFEWMPIREPTGRPLEATWRSFRFGDLANLIMVETRLAARDLQLDYETDLGADPAPEAVEAFKRRLADPARKLMGAEQLRWVIGEASRPGPVWQVLGNQVLMARLQPPSLKRELGEARAAEIVAAAPEGLKSRIARMEAMAALGLPTALDIWDGYPAERQRLLQGLVGARANTLVLTGDSHAAWANELHLDDGRRAAVEFGATSITSPGSGDSVREIDLPALYTAANREVRYVDMRAKGFCLLTLTREAALCEYVAVSTIHAKPFETQVVKRYRATPGAAGVSALSEA